MAAAFADYFAIVALQARADSASIDLLPNNDTDSIDFHSLARIALMKICSPLMCAVENREPMAARVSPTAA